MKRMKFLLLSVAAISVFVIYMVIVSTDPYSAPKNIRLLFYLAVFGAATGLYGLARLTVIRRLFTQTLYISDIAGIIRQGMLIGATLTILLALQALRILSVLDATFTIIAAIMFELFFRVKPPITAKE